MSHSDTIVDRYGIELGCETTEFFDFGLNNLTDANVHAPVQIV